MSRRASDKTAPRLPTPLQEPSQLTSHESTPRLGSLTSRTGLRLRVDSAELRPGRSVAANQSLTHEGVEATDSLEQFVFRHGLHFDAYLATEPGRMMFRSQSREGLISYTQRGPYVLVGGGLIAPETHKPKLLEEFLKFLAQNKQRVAFHNVGDEELPLFRKHGFEITKWGEEPIIDLPGLTWSGKAFEWVRRQTNFCLRNGLEAVEVRPETLSSDQWSRLLTEIREVSDDSLSLKPQSEEMKFFEGRIGDHALGLRRLFVARSNHGAGRLEGFLICNPMLAGTRWSTELYRRRSDTVRGTMPYLFHHAMQQLQSEGVERVGLCLEPGFNCEIPLPGDSALLRRILGFNNRHLGFIFDYVGLRHFKSRFRPRYENRYVCALPKLSVGSIAAFIQVSGLHKLSLVKVGRILLDRWRKRAARKTLTDGSPMLHETSALPCQQRSPQRPGRAA